MPAPSNTPSARKVRAHRARLRAMGLRPVQVWVRDTRKPGFKRDAHRQSQAVAAADRRDEGLFEFMDAAWANLDEH